MTSSTPSAPRFDHWLDDFFNFFYRRHPVEATFTGIHEYDHALPDFSPEANADATAAMNRLRDDLAALPDEPLSEAQRHDRTLAAGILEIKLWENESAHFHLGNPSLYTGEAVFSVMSLFHRDREPVADRAAAAISRMRAIPAFLAQGRANIAAAPADWTDRAIRESQSGIAYFGSGIALLAEEYGIDSPDLNASAATVAEAFETHRNWLEETLKANANEHYSAGREAFELMLRYGHQLPSEQDTDWLRDYAKKAMAEAQAELERRGEELDSERSWQDQLSGLADSHPSTEDYYGAYQRVWDDAKAAATSADLVTWPEFPIEYGPFPRSDRQAAQNLYYLFYRCPAPFGQPAPHYYRVTPIEPEMPPIDQERLLRANNDSAIKLNHVVHHGGLGHHVQNWNAFRAESRIGKVAGVDASSRLSMFCAGSLVEGWACYATDLAEEIGFLTPLETLAERQSRARMAARAVADVAIHTNEMTLDEAAAFYEREAGMTPAAARGEAVKNSMFPGAAMMYLFGTNAIHDLRRQIAARDGDAFSLRAFHDRFLSYGAIPVAMIARAMLQ